MCKIVIISVKNEKNLVEKENNAENSRRFLTWTFFSHKIAHSVDCKNKFVCICKRLTEKKLLWMHVCLSPTSYN